MNHYIFRLMAVAVGLSIVSACASAPVYTSQERGSSQETPSRFVDKESKIIYSVQHDSRFLYINLSTADQTSQRQILMQGISVWTDQYGKKREYVGFTYPLADRPQGRGPGGPGQRPGMGNGDMMPPAGMGDQKRATEDMIRQFESQISYIELIGFLEDGSKERLNYRLEKGPVKVDISMDDSGNLLYQAKVPLQNIFTDESAKDRMLSVGIESKAPEGRNGNGPPAGGPPGGGGGGGMPQGGGMPGGGGQGGPPGGGPDMESSPSIDFWFKVLI